MNALVGTGSLIGLILRRDRAILPIWIVVLAIVPAGVASSFAELYPTPEARQALALTVVGNPALASILGPVYDTSVGGLTAWRIGSFTTVLVGLMSLLTVIRHTRAEEETGRRELLGSTVVGRHAPLSAALAVAGGANLVLAAFIAGGLIGVGLPTTGAMAMGLGFAAAGMVFAAVAAVAAQMASSVGGARGIAITVLGISFLLRVAGDASGEGEGLSWLSWLSPIGWTQRIRPFADERWWPLALSAAVFLSLTFIAYVLTARRDMGAGILPPRLGPATASPRLRSPLALAWRLQSGGLLAWNVSFAIMGFVIGGVAQSVSEILRDTPQLQLLLARIGGESALVDMYFSMTMSIFAIVASAYAIQAALRLRTEEEALRAETVLATSVGRLRWATSHLIFAALGPAALLAAAGAAAGLNYALSTGEIGRELPRVTLAAVAQLPAVWVLTGLAIALYGLQPRFASMAWAVLVGCLLLGQLGQILQLGKWLLDLSPFTHVPNVLISGTSPAPLLWLTGVAAALAIAGLVGLQRRDIGRL